MFSRFLTIFFLLLGSGQVVYILFVCPKIKYMIGKYDLPLSMWDEKHQLILF